MTVFVLLPWLCLQGLCRLTSLKRIGAKKMKDRGKGQAPDSHVLHLDFCVNKSLNQVREIYAMLALAWLATFDRESPALLDFCDSALSRTAGRRKGGDSAPVFRGFCQSR